MSAPTNDELSSEIRHLKESAKSSAEQPESWVWTLQRASDEALVAFTATIHASSFQPRAMESFRESVRAEMDRRLSAREIDAMNSLENKAKFVGWVGVALAAVEVFTNLFGS